MQWLAHWYFQFEPVFKDSVPGLVLLLGGGLVNLVLSRLVLRALHRSRLPLSIDTKLLIRRSTAWLLWLMLILLVLHAWGVKVDGIWTMLASALAVIGVGLLAVWTMASNITASLFIWIWRPYNLGQHIEILPEGLKGRAVDRSMMFTEIEEENGSTLMVPNNLIFQRIIRRAPDGKKSMVDDLEGNPGHPKTD